MQRNAFQTSTMTLNVMYIAVFGLCFLLMSSQELLAQSQEESLRDSLSGTLNRRGIEARLALELKRCNRAGQRLSVALVDLDWFKAINDTLGHAAGDRALRAVAEAMETRLREFDSLGRYGGDEFLVVLPNTILKHAAAVAERLRAAVGESAASSNGEQLTLSIGITEASPEDDAITLIARADEALYQAKSAGRDCWRAVAPAIGSPEETPGYAARMQAEG
jgi:diguanylate cyclase (GGDEF)-like protein